MGPHPNRLFGMANNDLPLDDLSIFVTVVEAGGFRAAAARLNRAPSTISETVARLEAHVGTPLLVRSTRAMRPTEAGSTLLERVQPLLREARAALEGITHDAMIVQGPLRLNVPKAVMLDILPPIIDRFMDRYPEVSVEITVEDSFVDAIATGAHAGIRYEESLEQDMISVPIGPARQCFALGAAPAYLERRGVPMRPHDVMDHDRLAVRFASGRVTPMEFTKGDQTITLSPPPRLLSSPAAAESLIAHAVAGRGLIQAFGNWLEPHFATGRLVPLLQDWWPGFDGPRLYFSSRFMPAPLRALVDLIAEERQTTSRTINREREK